MQSADRFWEGRRVVVTGGAGFIGSHVVDRLVGTRGVATSSVVVPRSAQADLRSIDACRRALCGSDVVLHLAARVGGLDYSTHSPATQYYDCLAMDLNVVEAARLEGVGKVVLVSSACAYPRDTSYPLREDDLFNGLPQETNRAYGLAKRMQIAQAEAYRKQYGMNVAVVVPANAYGPRDHFDIQSSHVVPALIRKCLDQSELVVWGDGSATRDFLFADDFAEGVILAAEKLEEPVPVNLGTGRETTIRDLVDAVIRATGFRGPVRYDATRPTGQPKRVLDTSRAKRLLGFEPRVSLGEGIRRTVEWYVKQAASG